MAALPVQRCDRSFTVALAFLAILTGRVAFLTPIEFEGAPPQTGFGLAELVHLTFGLFFASAAAAAVVRALGLKAAWMVTNASCYVLLFLVPPGAGLFVWWVGWLRDRERPPRATPPPLRIP